MKKILHVAKEGDKKDNVDDLSTNLGVLQNLFNGANVLINEAHNLHENDHKHKVTFLNLIHDTYSSMNFIY